VGYSALYASTEGVGNVAVGLESLKNVTSGTNNIGLGYVSGANITIGSYNIDIGNIGSSDDFGTIRIGTNGKQSGVLIAGIDGVPSVSGSAVYVNSSGALGILLSSARFKFDIHDMGARSDRLMDLRPVMFRYKKATPDGSHPIQFGLIAEEVAKVYPDLVQYDKQGKPLTVYYHLLTPIMLDQLQKAHHQLTAQQTQFSALRATVQRQSSALQTQSAVLQTQNSALQSQSVTLQAQSFEVASLRHTVRLMLMIAAALTLVALISATYLLSTRTWSLLKSRTRQMAECVS
jgi:hypothetical protein